MISISNTFATTIFLPSHTCGRGVGGEGEFELPGVARRLVTFFCFAKKKVTKDNEVAVKANMRSMLCRSQKATPIHHLFEVPCVAQQVRLPHKLARFAARPRAQTYSSEFPDLFPLLGGGTGGVKKSGLVDLMKQLSDQQLQIPPRPPLLKWGISAAVSGEDSSLCKGRLGGILGTISFIRLDKTSVHCEVGPA